MSMRARLVRLTPTLFLIGGAMLLRPPTILAQTDETRSLAFPSASEGGATTSDEAARDGWVQRWFQTVDKARASQPHFAAPLVTSHVVLVEQYRYDMSWQQDTVGGMTTSNYGASRGLEIIPTTR